MSKLFLTIVVSAFAAAADVEPLFSAGVAAYAAEDYERALKSFEEAVRLKPDESRYHHWMGKAAGRRAERVNPLRATGLARKTRTAFERAVELDPSSPGPLFDLFQYYLEAPGILGGGEDKARAAIERLAKLSARHGHHARAELLAKRKEYPAAEQEYRRALEADPAALGVYLDLAVFLTRRDRLHDALALLDRAAKAAPNSPAPLYARGQCLVIAKKDPQKARQLLEQYLKAARQPDDPPPSEARDLLRQLPQRPQASPNHQITKC